MQRVLKTILLKKTTLQNKKNYPSPGGLEPPTFRLTAERANRLRHGDSCFHRVNFMYMK